MTVIIWITVFFSQGVSVGMGMTGMKDTLLAGDALDKQVSEIVKNQVWRLEEKMKKSKTQWF